MEIVWSLLFWSPRYPVDFSLQPEPLLIEATRDGAVGDLYGLDYKERCDTRVTW